MSIKDKFIFGIMIILLVAGGYVQYSYTLAQEKMEKLDQQQQVHVADVNNEFREDLRVLNLQFIGRGKHLQQAQKDIVANTDFIKAVTDSLSDMIEDVRFNLSELERSTERQFSSLSGYIEDIEGELNRTKKSIRSLRGALDQDIQNLKNNIKELEDLEIIVKAKEKEAKDKE